MLLPIALGLIAAGSFYLTSEKKPAALSGFLLTPDPNGYVPAGQQGNCQPCPPPCGAAYYVPGFGLVGSFDNGGNLVPPGTSVTPNPVFVPSTGPFNPTSSSSSSNPSAPETPVFQLPPEQMPLPFPPGGFASPQTPASSPPGGGFNPSTPSGPFGPGGGGGNAGPGGEGPTLLGPDGPINPGAGGGGGMTSGGGPTLLGPNGPLTANPGNLAAPYNPPGGFIPGYPIPVTPGGGPTLLGPDGPIANPGGGGGGGFASRNPAVNGGPYTSSPSVPAGGGGGNFAPPNPSGQGTARGALADSGYGGFNPNSGGPVVK